MKNKKIQILEFGTVWYLSVEFITFEIIRNSANLSIYCTTARSQNNKFKGKTNQNWMQNNMYMYINLPNM